MKARILKVQSNPSRKTNGVVYMIAFKGEDGKSYVSWVDSGFRNYAHWRDNMSVGTMLDNLIVAKDNLINADSRPRVIKDKEPEKKELVKAEKQEVAIDSLFGKDYNGKT